MKSRVLCQLTGVLIISTLLACSNAMQLAYTKPLKVPYGQGELSVIVDDQRVPDRGGNDPLTVGIARNAFGMPFAIKASPKREPTKVVKELISECLMASGFKVVDESNDAPQLHAVLKVFWSDGYQHSRMGMLMPMELKNKESSPLWKYDLDVNTGFTWKSAGFSQFNAGFNNMLDEAKDRLLQQFQSSQFADTYQKLK